MRARFYSVTDECLVVIDINLIHLDVTREVGKAVVIHPAGNYDYFFFCTIESLVNKYDEITKELLVNGYIDLADYAFTWRDEFFDSDDILCKNPDYKEE